MKEINGRMKIKRSDTLKRKKVAKVGETGPFARLLGDMFDKAQSEEPSQWQAPEVWNHAAYAEIFGLTDSFKKDTL